MTIPRSLLGAILAVSLGGCATSASHESTASATHNVAPPDGPIVKDGLLVWPRDGMPATVVFSSFEASGTIYLVTEILDLQPVSWRQFRAFREANYRDSPGIPPAVDDRSPATVTAEEAVAYAKWAGRRLACESELQRAAGDAGAKVALEPEDWWMEGQSVRARGDFAAPEHLARVIRVGPGHPEWILVGWHDSPTSDWTWRSRVDGRVEGHVSRPAEPSARRAFRCAVDR